MNCVQWKSRPSSLYQPICSIVVSNNIPARLSGNMINLCYLPARGSVLGKTVPWVNKYLRPSAQIFSIQTDPGWPANTCIEHVIFFSMLLCWIWLDTIQLISGIHVLDILGTKVIVFALLFGSVGCSRSENKNAVVGKISQSDSRI